MDYQVQVATVPARLTAIVRRRAKQSELPKVVPAACGDAWALARALNLSRPGRHVALYLDCEMNLEIGMEVEQPFTGNDQLICSSLPSGRVASTVHQGPYQLLANAHRAVQEWCAQHGLPLAGPSWEIYGHWTDDPSQLYTEVGYLLQG